MASQSVGRLVLCLLCIKSAYLEYSVPDVKIQALSPKGIRVSIPDSAKLTLFVFQGNINKQIGNNDIGLITGEITSATNGRWLYEDLNLQLKVGDVINYYVYVVFDKKGYIKDKLSFIVKVLENPSSTRTDMPTNCEPTETLVRNGQACAGQILFEDNFDSLREDLWQIEQYIPGEPDFPFVSYQRPFNVPTVSVEGGYLRIEPKLQQNQPGFSTSSITTGNLDLFSGCTSTSTQCRAESWGASILPPIVSGRLTSKSFAFTYGIVEVRAKLPQGDWLYPDILLEPLMKRYGLLDYSSGIMRIAGARGNAELSSGNTEIGNNVLYGGLLMDKKCRDTLLKNRIASRQWGDDFHVYALHWTSDRIILSVDGEEWARIMPSGGALRDSFSRSCNVPRIVLATGSHMAPFDDHNQSSTRTDTAANCEPTETLVRNGQACAGQILFEDNFDSLREDLWQIERYIPGEPDFPFISYQHPFNVPIVSVEGGYLRIESKLQQNQPGFSTSSIITGNLDLFSGCTSSIPTQCRAESWGASILPPIVSGRLTSKSFAFTYGIVEVRAKLPQGDWLYPDILLEPLIPKFGLLDYHSGIIRIAGARGNAQLSSGNTEIGNNILYGGVLMAKKCRDTLLKNRIASRQWGDDFHVYALHWSSDRIILSVDGEEWVRIMPSGGTLRDSFSRSCNVPRILLATGSNMSPFDDHFYLTLGLAAGGITEFPDNLTSRGKMKPWKNSSRKASLHFWQDLNSWISTWRQPVFLVDYVRVRAL